MAHYSILIKNGTVFDGSGSPSKKLDIAIDGEKIKKVDDYIKASADIVIDASGKYIAPGFIDITNHSDTHWTLFSSPSQENLLRQGITTILGGTCGSSLAPFVGTRGIESLNKWIDPAKVNINWQSMDEYLSILENKKISLNYGTFVGHNTIRQAILGDEAREATPEELSQMKLLLDESLRAGAFGLSTNLGYSQKRYLRDTEIIELFKIVAKRKKLTKHHLEDEGKNILPALSRIIQISRESGVKFHVSHLKAVGRTAWGMFSTALEIVRNAKEDGLGGTCDFYPYNATGSTLYMLLPSWAREVNPEILMEILKNKKSSERNDLISYFKDITLHYDRIIVASSESNFHYVGKSLAQIQESTGLTSEEVVLTLLELNNLRVSIFNQALFDENIKLIAQEKNSVVGTDGVGYSANEDFQKNIPHPRSYGTFPMILRKFVREEGLLKWEEAINKMSGMTADILGLEDRGYLKKGYFADISIFDPSDIKEKATLSEPGEFSEGMEYVLVNGEIVLNKGNLIDNFNGKVLRKK